MVIRMIKNYPTKNKCARIDICDDYRMLDNLSNPYCYSFGTIERNINCLDVRKLQNRVNAEYFSKR